MGVVQKTTIRRVARPVVLSFLGALFISPIPILAAKPGLAPAWLLRTTNGVPVLSWAILLLMAALVVVALSCLTQFDGKET